VTITATEDPIAARELYSAVHGQDRVIDQLRRAAARPVHAYLFVGPPGTGKHEAALAFAASLLCPNGGDGTCRVCRQVLAGSYVDVSVIERLGPFISVDQAHEITRIASRTPTEGRRKVLVLVDFHLADKAAPALLKTIEEPPPSTVFVILADHVPPELVTIASRCVRLDFLPLTEETISRALEGEGVAPAAAAEAARAAGGRMDRARILTTDAEVAARRSAWESVPARLDGTGATVAIIANELLDLLARGGAEGLAERHAAELEALEERERLTGERGSGRRELEARQKREQRRWRIDELRWGLAILAAAYRDRAARASSARGASDALRAADAVQDAAEALIRNPNEMLLLQALLLRLQPGY